MLFTAEEWGVVLLSLKVSAVAVGLTVPIAFALAWLLARKAFPGKILVDAAVHLPLVLPPVVTGWLLLLAFGNTGPAGRWLDEWLGLTFMFRWTGAALAAAVMALPLMVRAMRLSIEAVDRRLEDAARTLGASPLRTFATITLPLAVPGLLAGAVLGFARSIGEFGATITFVSNIPGETRTLPLAIYGALQVPGSEAAVTRLSVIAVALSLAALVASELLARRAGQGKGSHVL
jgi:molybdate transport system permease protein